MAFQFKNRVRGVSTTLGTGTYTVGAAPTGFQNFNQITSGRQVFYCALMGANWEVGIGTVTVGGTVTLSRDLILESSTGAAINWGAGDKEVFLVAPAGFFPAITYDGSIHSAEFGGTMKVTGKTTLQAGMNVAESVGGTANAITATLTPAITAYGHLMMVVIFPISTNTGAVTLALNGLAARDIHDRRGIALAGGELVANRAAILLYDNVNSRWWLMAGDTYISGTFTVNISGCTAPVSGTLNYRIANRRVTIYNNTGNDIKGTSNDSTTVELTTLPAVIQPSGDVVRVAGCFMDNSVITPTDHLIAAGTIYVVKNFSPSGGKGIPVGWQISYDLP